MKNIKLVLFVLGLNIVFVHNVCAKDAETDKVIDETGTKINPEVLYKDYIDQGLYFFERGMLNRAKYLFYNAKELIPEKPDSYINMAAIAMKRNNFSMAAKILEKSLKLTDSAKQDAIFCNLGSCYQKLEKYEEAKKCYEKAISLNPELGNALFNLGMLDLKEGKEDAALINILKARVIFREQGNKDVVRSCDETLFSIIKNHKNDTKLAQMLLAQGSASFENKRNEEAIALLKISLLLSPDNQETYYRLGVIYTNSKNFEEAITCFNKTIELNPQNVKAYLNMGAIFGELKKYNEALNILNKALSLEKNNPKIYYNIAMVYMSNTNKKKAAAYLKKAKIFAEKDKDEKLLKRIDEAYKAL